MIRMTIDPASISSGWCVYENGVYLDSGTIKFTQKNPFQRLSYLYDAYLALFYQFVPDEVYIETIPISQNFGKLFTMKPLFYSVGVIGAALSSTETVINDRSLLPKVWQKAVDWNGKRDKLRRFKVDSEDELAAIGMSIYLEEKDINERQARRNKPTTNRNKTRQRKTKNGPTCSSGRKRRS